MQASSAAAAAQGERGPVFHSNVAAVFWMLHEVKRPVIMCNLTLHYSSLKARFFLHCTLCHISNLHPIQIKGELVNLPQSIVVTVGDIYNPLAGSEGGQAVENKTSSLSVHLASDYAQIIITSAMHR